MTEHDVHQNDVEANAEQRLIDAMLRGVHQDTPDALNARLQRVRSAIAAGAPEVDAPDSIPLRRPLRWQRYVQAAVGGAGALAAVLFLAVLLQPTPVGATALLEQARAAEALAANGDQRYQVQIHPPHGAKGRPVLDATLDVRNGKFIRFELTQPDGSRHIWGLGRKGPWERGPRAEMRPGRGRPWPGWLESGSQALLIDTMPALLDLVVAGYEATTVESEDGASTRIIATQRDPLLGGPDEVVIELDPEQQGVQVLELRWNPGSDARWRRMHGMSSSGSEDNARGEMGRARRGPGAQSGTRGAEDRRSRSEGMPERGRRSPRGSNAEGEDGQQAQGVSERRRERWDRPRRGAGQRPGGPPPAPSLIRFERLPGGPVSEDWFEGPVSGWQSEPKQ
ncbi:MAG: hypothetical protein MK085_09270 [Phycisphaerales bacterium]|nr:hypothetical protein [Phycisphaerales bacterium]